MTSESNWNPGHSTNKGYPYNNIPSKEMFVNRPQVWVNDDNKPQISWDPKLYPDAPDPKEWTESEANNPFIAFLMCRLIDYHESLCIAEEQVQSLLEEKPFLPEHFGFELVHKHEDISEPPVRVYLSKYNTSISLYRKPGDVNDIEWNPSLWMLIRKNESGQFKIDEVHLPCHRIAYAMFCALQIQIEEAKELPAEETNDLSDKTDSVPLGFNVYGITYSGKPTVKHPDGLVVSFDVVAEDKPNAISRAKFLIETNPDYNVVDVAFEEIEAIEK